VFYPHWSPILIILCYACSLLDITYYLSACSCMPMLTTRFSIHTLLIRIYRYTCVYLCTPLGFHHTTRWRVSDSPRSLYADPGAYEFSRLLIRDAQWSVDLRQTVWDPILPGPLARLSSFPFVTRERFLYCTYLYISLYSHNCAYQWCNILIILYHILW